MRLAVSWRICRNWQSTAKHSKRLADVRESSCSGRCRCKCNRSHTNIAGSSMTPSTVQMLIYCWRRLVAHYMPSVFDEFNPSQFVLIQLETFLKQSEVPDGNVSTLEGRQEMLNCASSAYKDEATFYALQSVWWGRLCKKWTTAAPERIPAVLLKADGWWTIGECRDVGLWPVSERRETTETTDQWQSATAACYLWSVYMFINCFLYDIV